MAATSVKVIKARTPQAKEIWNKKVSGLFPDAKLIDVQEFGFKATTQQGYSVIWRYSGVPQDDGMCKAVFEWLRDVGEHLEPGTAIEYQYGLVNRWG